jgi:hypothetical protein
VAKTASITTARETIPVIVSGARQSTNNAAIVVTANPISGNHVPFQKFATVPSTKISMIHPLGRFSCAFCTGPSSPEGSVEG